MRSAVSDGLTPRQLRALKEDYGSLRAAAKARPELAEQLAAVERMRAQLGEVAEALAAPFPLRALPEPEGIDGDALIEHEAAKVRRQAQIADDLAAVRREIESGAGPDAREDDDVHPRSNPAGIRPADFWKVVELLGDEDVSLHEIERRTEGRVLYHDVRKIRDWRDAPGRTYRLHVQPISGEFQLLKPRNPPG